MYSVLRYVPRRSSQSCMIAPMYSDGRMKLTLRDRLAELLDVARVGDPGRVGDVERLALAW